MLTRNKTGLSVNISNLILFPAVIGFSLSAQAGFPLGNDGGIPNLEGMQIGMSPAQVQEVLEAKGYIANPSAPGKIYNYNKGKNAISLQPGKDDPLAFVRYSGSVEIKKGVTFEGLKAISQQQVDQFIAVFGDKSKCDTRQIARGYANCEYIDIQQGQVKHHVGMSLSGGFLQIVFRGNPGLAANYTPNKPPAANTQQQVAKASRYSVTLKNNEVYINGMKLGMPESAVKQELGKLNYKYNSKGAHQLKAGDDKDAIQAFLQRHQLQRITTNEQDITGQTRDDIIKSIKATFGSRVKCHETTNPHAHVSASCNAVIKVPGKRTSFTASFTRQGSSGKYIYQITLM